MVMNWHSKPVMMMLPNISTGQCNLYSTFTHNVSCSSYNSLTEPVPLIFYAMGLEAEDHRGVYSYTAHEVVDLRSLRDDCSQQQ